jgi:uncharacterized protein
LRSPGSPLSIFGLFGGPGFLFVLILIVALAGGIAYLAITDRSSLRDGAGVALPGPEVRQAMPTSKAPMELQSIPAVPAAKYVPVPAEIREDLTPIELLAKYPPDPAARLEPGGAEVPSWRRYGRASAISADAPRLALIITGLGRNRADTVRAITGAPPEMSLSFDAEAVDLEWWIAAARAYGHEALLDIPMRSGAAQGLSPDLAPVENLRRLDAMLARAPMVAGVAITGGDPFLGEAAALNPILKRLESSGLTIVGLPVTAPLTIGTDDVIAGEATPKEIGATMRSVIALARRRGAALAGVDSASASDLLTEWYDSLAAGEEISLVPVTALVED